VYYVSWYNDIKRLRASVLKFFVKFLQVDLLIRFLKQWFYLLMKTSELPEDSVLCCSFIRQVLCNDFRLRWETQIAVTA